MANERRLRVNNVKGTLGASLAASATTVNLGATLSAAATPDANSYLPVTLEPDTANEEIIYITGGETVLGNHTYPCVKAREGSSDLPHGTVVWLHGPTAADLAPIAYPIDLPWGGDLGYDYEFDAKGPTSTLPPGWAWTNQGAAVYTEDWGAGMLQVDSASWNVHILDRPLAGLPATWTATIKASAGPTGLDSLGPVVLRDSVSGKFYSIGVHGTGSWDIFLWNSTISPSVSKGTRPNQYGAPVVYYRITKNSATSYDIRISGDGVAWDPFVLGLNPTTDFGHDADRIGMGMPNDSGLTRQCAFHWLRIR